MKKKPEKIKAEKITPEVEFKPNSYLHNEFIKVFGEFNEDFKNLNKEYDSMRMECSELLDVFTKGNIDYALITASFKRMNVTLEKYIELKNRVEKKYYNDIMDAYSFDNKADTAFYLKLMSTLWGSVKAISDHVEVFEKMQVDFKKKYSEFME